MSDYRLVQCFGIKKQPHKPDQPCQKRWMWSATEANKYRFGRTGTNACPNCGSFADFKHPYNKYLNGEMNKEQAEAAMPEYIKLKETENNP